MIPTPCIVNYDITYENRGDRTATDVKIEDDLSDPVFQRPSHPCVSPTLPGAIGDLASRRLR